ncbi:MAG: cysteine synthase family protein [Deltaproteobacteria bacterium]|nr:MAG: cysteine synthase family protein [Deltaproteobacteria bacterium]
MLDLPKVAPPPAVDSIFDLVGNTPLVRLSRLDAEFDGVEIYAKCEFANPGGSVKDRAALRIVRDAMARGDLGKGRRLLDSTSGNTGIAYAFVGAALGIPVTLVMPENVSEPRKLVTAEYGVEVVFSDPMEGSDGAIRLARDLAARYPDRYYYPNQYANRSNWRAHYDGTGVEIWQQTEGRVTHFVTGLGTTGTMMGTSRRLKAYDPRIHCTAVQPEDAFHGLEGLKHLPSSIVPPIYDPSVPDETIWMPTEEGWDTAERLARDEALFVGHSSGANVAGALRIARRLADEGRPGVVVTILCDRGDRYFESLAWDRHHPLTAR